MATNKIEEISIPDSKLAPEVAALVRDTESAYCLIIPAR
jgi:hypothetical protein